MRGRISDTRSRIPSRRLAQDLLFPQIRYLLQNHLLVRHICNDEHMLNRYNRSKTVHRHLQQTSTRSEEIQKLLRLTFPAEWPKTTSYAARHDHTIVILCSHVSLKRFHKKCTKLQLFFYIRKCARKIFIKKCNFPLKILHFSLFTFHFPLFFVPLYRNLEKNAQMGIFLCDGTNLDFLQ